MGAPGASYGNRTDLNQNRSLPVRTATGQTYGVAQAQAEAQRAMPMRAAPMPAPAQGAPAPMPAPAGGPASPPVGAPIPPGAFGDLHRPTERPYEPVTAGAVSGPGPGPEALMRPPNVNRVSSVLQQAAQRTGSPVLSRLASQAQAAGQ